MNRPLSHLALLALAPLAAPSCLVTAKQDFPAPPQTPPFLSASDAKPTLQRVLVLPTGKERVQFTTTVRSEDDGQPLHAQLVLDDLFPEDATGNHYFPVIFDKQKIDASTFDDTARHVTLTFNPAVPSGKVSPGCHRFTVNVSHSFFEGTNQPQTPADQDFLVWWVVLGDPKNPAFAPTVAAMSCPP